jgi:hypothetical protein
MKKMLEFLLSLFFSKEAIALVRQEAVQDGRTALTRYENKKYLSKFQTKKRYRKVPSV